MLTHEAPDAPEDPTITFLSGGVRSAVATPLLLGDGVRLFGHQGTTPFDLETTSVEWVGQLTNLRFRVVE